MVYFDVIILCMVIGFVLFKILRFYVFKMAANCGRHFEIEIKTENFQIQFIPQKHACIYAFDMYDLCLLCK